MRPFLRPFICGWINVVEETAAWRFKGIDWHEDGTSPAFKFRAAGIWLPFVVGVAIIMFVLAGEFDVSLIGLIQTFEEASSLLSFDDSERGTNGLPEFSIVIRGGELGIEMILGDKFVDWKKNLLNERVNWKQTIK